MSKNPRGPQAVVCIGKYRSHRFSGQPNCYRCGASLAELKIARIRKWGEIYKANRGMAAFSARAYDDPYAAGYEAFSKDLRNPFKPDSPQHDQWFEGWHNAAAEADRRDQEAA